MTEMIVHHPHRGATVFNRHGHLIGPHSNRPAEEGDPVTGRLLERGRLVRVTRPDAEEPAESITPEEAHRPALNASTAKWVEYAQLLGYTAEELEGFTRTEIIELIDGDEDPDTGEQDSDGATADSGAETDTEQETE